jgi:transcriptional regulator with XRE-family HTH domain
MKSNPEPIRKVLAGNIKKYRHNFRYSQEKLAEKAGLSKQTLNDIEGCRRWVSSQTISRLAKALNVAEYQLLIPENDNTVEKKRNSSLESLIELKKTIHSTVDLQFEKAVETGNFV